jgi:hypothetical protein
MPFDRPQPAKQEGVDPVDLRELQIIKQAIIKSLLESGQVKECNPVSRKLVLDWVSFVRRNGAEEKSAYHPLPF